MKLVKFGELYLELLINGKGWSLGPTFHSSNSENDVIHDPWKYAREDDIVILASAEKMKSQYPTRTVTDTMKKRAHEVDIISEINSSAYADYFYIKLKKETHSHGSISVFCWDFMMFSAAFKILKVQELDEYIIYDYLNNCCVCKLFKTTEEAKDYIYYEIACNL